MMLIIARIKLFKNKYFGGFGERVNGKIDANYSAFIGLAAARAAFCWLKAKSPRST